MKFHYYHISCLIKESEDKCAEYLKANGEGYRMFNLAGRIENNPYINLELSLAGIHILKGKSKGEVQYNFEGYIGSACEFKFHRAWAYWIVDGFVPLYIANELYADPVGEKVVRVQGHCGCPPPEQWAKTIPEHGEELFVTCYHIDSWQGLKLFADKIKKFLNDDGIPRPDITKRITNIKR